MSVVREGVVLAEFKEGDKANGRHYKIAQNFRFNVIPRPPDGGGSGSTVNPPPVEEIVELPPEPVPETAEPEVGVFDDVKKTVWFYDDVMWAYEATLMIGVAPR
jgi:hypothetical protein